MIPDSSLIDYSLIDEIDIPFPHIALISGTGIQKIYAFRFCNDNSLDKIILVSIETEDEMTIMSSLRNKIEVMDELEMWVSILE